MRRLDIVRVDVVHARASRPTPEGHFKPQHRIGVPLGEYLDAAIVPVANVALNALSLRCVLDEHSEPDSLYSASDDESASDKHAELYRSIGDAPVHATRG